MAGGGEKLEKLEIGIRDIEREGERGNERKQERERKGSRRER